MSSYPEETARTWSHQPPPSYHAPGVSFCPTQTQQTTGMRACQSAPEYGGNFNWPENGNETQFG